ncbi:recombinase zinc beta ribbon domain-containing protein [Devosia sp. MC532]|uniref:recombinase zinc beta ribbon domain-containing protein n=1 Tax=Devosia sp. MC532 TaxID=2799788 RepID=UPI0018F74E9B|nr:recombinase zinc beta ribbon domain-containing protein [Devosia sp. MC532]MBJ7579308.1 recombinase zinc beta ribbon domain-containing protein [Devosia sp. MC532]
MAEGLEAFAAGRIQTQAEFARWLDAQPHFNKGNRKRITDQQAHDILTNLLYAGYLERAEWGVERRKAQHDGLISYETYERIQKRLNRAAYAPARPDVSADFPLRGAISCGCCGKPMTACWSKSKTGQRHPYYLCFAKECERYRKSIRREKVETEFVGLLEGMTPRPELLALSKALFCDAWNQRSAQAKAIARSYERQLSELDQKITGLLDRIVDATTSTVVAAFERRIGQLEREKLVLKEKIQNAGTPRGTFDEMFELAFAFLSNPSKLWGSGKLEYQKLVLKLAFSAHLEYCPETGFRTPKNLYRSIC